jgi:hypothetical protein
MKKFKIVYLKNGKKLTAIHEHNTLRLAWLGFSLCYEPDEIISITELTEE